MQRARPATRGWQRRARSVWCLVLLAGTASGTIALSGCSGSDPETQVKGASVERPGLASLNGTVIDGSGWKVQIVVSVGHRSYPTTSTADGSYTVADIPPGHATVSWSALSYSVGINGPVIGEAQREGSLGVDLTAGANHVDIQL